jgi:Flp pilus assembly protein TadD
VLTGIAVYGTVRTVVWEDGGSNPASYPIRLPGIGRLFLAATRTKPNDPKPVFNLGLVYFNTGEMENARMQFTAALRLDPDLTKVRANLGGVLERLGRYEEAVQQFGEILKTDPNNAEAHRSLAAARAKLGGQ